MAQFLGDIAFMFEMFAIAWGLVLLQRAQLAEKGAGYLRAAGVLVALSGASGALCTSYYWFSYQADGGFDFACGQSERMRPHAD